MLGTGGSGHFNCTVHGGRGGGVTLNWQHEGRPLHSPQPRLTLGPVRPHHVGLYQCTAYDHSDSAVAGAELVIAGNTLLSLDFMPFSLLGAFTLISYM